MVTGLDLEEDGALKIGGDMALKKTTDGKTRRMMTTRITATTTRAMAVVPGEATAAEGHVAEEEACGRATRRCGPTSPLAGARRILLGAVYFQ
jgi:hypothetical protein